MLPPEADAALVSVAAAVVSVAPATVVSAAGADVPPVVASEVESESEPHAAMNAVNAGMANAPIASWRRESRPLSCEAIKPSTVSFFT